MILWNMWDTGFLMYCIGNLMFFYCLGEFLFMFLIFLVLVFSFAILFSCSLGSDYLLIFLLYGIILKIMLS